MKRPVVVQLALAAILTGLLLLAVGATPPREPSPARTWRPATPAERREHDRKLLHEEMDRLWQERQP